MEYTIWITNDCNMKCRYCYVDKMKGTNSFAENSVARLIQFINETSKTVKEIKINFFGGEPLLKFDLIQFIIEKMEKELVVDVKYFLTTNGLLLNESIIEYFKEKKVILSLSWDGCENANDCNRIDKGGGTYQRIRFCYDKLKKCGMHNVRVRATFNSETIKYLKESVINFLLVDPNMSVIFVPDYFDQGWTDEKISDLQNVISSLSNMELYNISIMGDIQLKKCGCGGGISNYHIYVDGMIYPCSFVVNQKQFCLGDIWNGLNKEKIKELQINYHKMIQECNGCDYEKYCLSYKCRYLNWALTKELNKPAPIVCQLENIKLSSNINNLI